MRRPSLKTIFAAVIVAACGDSITDPPATLVSIAVTLSPPSITVGQSAQASATLKDASGNGFVVQGDTVRWGSSDLSVATVSTAGVVRGIGVGDAVITASVAGKTGSATLHVTAGTVIPPLPVATVTVTLNQPRIVPSQTALAVADLRDANGAALSGRVVQWSISPTAIATISQTGVITGQLPGTATITATSEGKSGTATIFVDPSPVTSITMSIADSVLPVNGITSVNVVLKDATGGFVVDRFATLSSTNPTVAQVQQNGTVTANGVGTAVIVAAIDGATGSVGVRVFAATAGTATKLSLSIGASATAQSGVAFAQQPAVQVLDGLGIPVTQAGVVVTASLNGTGTLGGTTTATTNSNGVATFTNLSITGATGVRTVLFTSPGLTSVTSGNIAITAGAASQLAIATQPSASAQSGTAFSQQPSIQLRDASGNAVSQAGVAVSASIASGSGALGGIATATTNAGGLATFTNLSLTGTGTFTLQFTAPALSPTVSSSIAVSSTVAATQLVVTTQPSTTAANGAAFAQQPAVQLRDPTGANVSQSGIVVTAAIAAGTGTLGGTTTATTNASGVATFTNLSITGSGSYTLRFTAPGLSPATSGSISLTASAATQLTMAVQPSGTATSGQALTQQPAVRLRDVSGNAVAQAGVAVTVTASAGVTLGGTATAITDPTGVATFTGLMLTGPAGSYVLTFSAPSLTPVTSTAISIGGASGNKLVIRIQPSATAGSGIPFAQQPSVRTQDAAGNPISVSGLLVTAAIETGNGTLGGNTQVATSATGVATFTNLSITGSGAHTLVYTASGVTSISSSSINITTAAAPTRLIITTQPSSAASLGVDFGQQPVIQVADATGSAVPLAGVSVTAAIATGGGTLGGTATIVTNASGTATFTNLSISGTAGSRTLGFSAPSLAAATSSAISVTTAPPPPPPPPAGASEPVYDPTIGVLVMQDNMDAYASATAMGVNPPGTSPRIVPIPSPVTTSTPVNNSTVVIVGRNGTGKALRMNYNGLVQQGADFETMNTPRKADTATYYFTYWARVTLSQPWTGAIALKWFEAWHPAFDRVQWNTHDHLPCPTAHRATYWQVYDQGRQTTCQGNQPVGPWWTDVTDGQWHRFTHAYRANTSRGSRDGFARMWIDGTKIIDISAATIGVTPPGGEKPWCLADDVDALAVNEGVVTVRWGGPQTSYASPPWTYDVDDFMWWVKK